MDSDVNTSGASTCESSFSWFFSLSSLSSWPLSSVSNCPLKGSPGEAAHTHESEMPLHTELRKDKKGKSFATGQDAVGAHLK